MSNGAESLSYGKYCICHQPNVFVRLAIAQAHLEYLISTAFAVMFDQALISQNLIVGLHRRLGPTIRGSGGKCPAVCFHAGQRHSES